MFANPIQLTYNHEKVFRTPYGGCLTCLAGFVILVWICVQVVHTILLDYTMVFQQKLAENLSENEAPPVYSISHQNLTVATKFHTTNQTAFPDPDLTAYVSAVFLQVQFNVGTGRWSKQFYPTVPCPEVIPSGDTRYQSLETYSCSGQQDQEIKLQGESGMLTTTDSYRYFLVIGTCEEFQSITGSNCSADTQYVTENMQYLQTENIYFTRFYNPTAFFESGALEYERVYDANGFQADNLLAKSMAVQQSQISVHNSAFISFFDHLFFITYTVRNLNWSLFPRTPKGADSFFANFIVMQSYELIPTTTYIDYTYTRINFVKLIAEIGGILYMVRTICNGMVNWLSAFSIDNSMMRRLYSTDKPKESNSQFPKPKPSTSPEQPCSNFLEELDKIDDKEELKGLGSSNNANEDELSGVKRLKESLEDKTAFQYTWQEFRTLNYNCFNWLCCCCPSCRHHVTLRDRLFTNGRKQLWAEIDLLYIIKQLRVARFTSQVYLKQHQIKLIRWFERYKIQPGFVSMDDEDDESHDEHQQQDAAKTNQLNETIDFVDPAEEFTQLLDPAPDDNNQLLSPNTKFKTSPDKVNIEAINYEDQQYVDDDNQWHDSFVDQSIREEIQSEIKDKFSPETNVIDQLILERVLGIDRPEDSGGFFKKILNEQT